MDESFLYIEESFLYIDESLVYTENWLCVSEMKEKSFSVYVRIILYVWESFSMFNNHTSYIEPLIANFVFNLTCEIAHIAFSIGFEKYVNFEWNGIKCDIMIWNRVLALDLGMLMKCKYFRSGATWDEKCSLLTRTLIFRSYSVVLLYQFFLLQCWIWFFHIITSSLYLFLDTLIGTFLLSYNRKKYRKVVSKKYQKVSRKYWIMLAINLTSSTPKRDNKNETSSVPNEVSITIEPENKSFVNPSAPSLAPTAPFPTPTAPPADSVFAIQTTRVKSPSLPWYSRSWHIFHLFHKDWSDHKWAIEKANKLGLLKCS